MSENNDKQPEKNDGGVWIALGLCFGIIAGIIFRNFAIGMGLGLAFGGLMTKMTNGNGKDDETH